MATQVVTMQFRTQGEREITDAIKAQTAALTELMKKSKESQKQASSGLQSLTAFAGNLANALTGAIAVIGKFASAMSTVAELGNEFVRAQSKIQLILKEVGADAPKTSKEYLKFAQTMSATTEASLGQVQALQSVALALGRIADPKTVNGAVRAGLALQNVIPNRDATQMTADLVKSMQGVLTPTLRLIPAVRQLTKEQLKNGDAITVINELYGSTLSAAVDTVAGRLNNLETVFKDFYLTTIGRAIFENQNFANALRVMTDEMQKVAPSVEDLAPMINSFVINVANLVADLLGTFRSVISGLGDVVAFAGIIASETTRVLAQPFQLLFDLITKALEQFVIVKDKVEDVLDIDLGLDGFDELEVYMENIGETVDDMVNSAGQFGQDFKKAADTAADGLETVEGIVRKGIAALKDFSKETTNIRKQGPIKTIDQAQLKKVVNLRKKYEREYAQMVAKNREKQAQEDIKWQEQLLKNQIKAQEELNRRAQEAQDKMSAAAEDRASKLLSIFGKLGEVIERIKKGAEEGEVGEAFKDIAVDAAAGLGTFALDMIQKLIMAFIEAIKDPAAFQEMIDGLLALIEGVIQAVMNPETMQMIIDGFLQLIQAVMNMLSNEEFITTLVDYIIQLVLSVIEMVIKNLPKMLSTLVKAILKGIGDFITGIIEMLAQPDFLSDFIVGIVNLILDVISGLAQMIDRIVLAILQNLLPIVIEVFKAVVKAIAQLFLRGMWEVLRILVRFATFGLVDIGDAPGQGGGGTARPKGQDVASLVTNAARKHTGGPVWSRYHNGGAPGMAANEVPIIAEKGEAVIPNAPASYQGLSTDGRGNIQGGGTSVYLTVQTVDAQSFGEWLQRGGMSAIIDAVNRGARDERGRTLQAAIKGAA